MVANTRTYTFGDIHIRDYHCAMICANCGKETNNPRFCSNKCAATHNNHLKPKRRREGSCKTCGKSLPTRLRYCDPECFNNRPTRATPKQPRDREMRSKKLVPPRPRDKNIREYVFFDYAEKGKPIECKVCGYATFVEVCHIRAVSSFPRGTDRSIIDDLSNLILLCPNHHWEFDHGLLVVE